MAFHNILKAIISEYLIMTKQGTIYFAWIELSLIISLISNGIIKFWNKKSTIIPTISFLV